jgi:enoyl-CoA hydratase/carnithine racemase
VAGGLELMLACDLVLAADTARIGDGHLNFGQLPGAGGSQRLPRAIGPIRAKQLMFTGDLIAARDALALGLVGEVVDDASLLERARAIAGSLATRSPTGVRGMKRLVNEGLQKPLTQALRFEINFVTDYATGCPDATEGLLAFAEKRTPRYMR